jgi:hypothetical protein
MWRRVSLKLNLIVVTAVFIIGGLMICITLPPGGPDGVAAVTTRGGECL